MNADQPTRQTLDTLRKRALVVGAVAAAACLAGYFANPEQFLRSYLVGYLFFAGIGLGCLALLMLHHLVGGGWGIVIRRLLESGTRTLPLLLALLVPVLLQLPALYIWARPEVVAHDHLLQHKSAWLNVPFFVGRAAFYFAVWLVLAWRLNRLTAEQERRDSAAVRSKLQLISGPGLVLMFLTVSFASIDWVMSLEPHWFSTMYGVIFIVGEALATLAFLVILLLLLSRGEPMSRLLKPQHFHDLGNLMFAFVMLWAYVAFSQLLIIWSGNLPEEIPWYTTRLRGTWGGFAVALIALHFALPFLLLLHIELKRRVRMLAAVAGFLLLVRLVDLFWVVAPAFHKERFSLHWLDAAAPVAVGGLWLAFFVRQLTSRPLEPVEAALLEGGH